MGALLHIVGDASTAVEVALTACGLGLNLLALGLAAMALWPRRKQGPSPRRPRTGFAARRRALHRQEARLLDEDVHGGP